MTTQVFPQDKKLEITFEPDEWPVIVKAFQQSPAEVRQLLGNWLKAKAAQLQQIKQVLGL
jgi:hypothetical protein